jgi:ATP-dependent helicase/nuclease subunit B
MAEALLGHVDVPGLRLLADPPADEPYAAIAGVAQVSRTICDDFEAEAQAAAAEVLDALNAGRTPVALVALDRELVRRVRALLEREQVPLLDETGWLLSTTRAAGDLVSLLRAARTGASADARLEWLKSWPPSEAAALDSLEALWRGRKRIAARQAADRLWQAAQNHLRPLQEPATLSLAGWLALLRDRLETCGSFTRLEGDAAGSQLLAALGFPGQAAWLPLAHSLQMDLAGFTAWVEATLQRLPFLPTPDAGARVVLMPLARSFGRPFAQVVIPGADHLRLGSGDAAPSLIGQAWAEAVGLETRATRRERQRLALAQVLRAPGVALLRRRRDGDEPLAESPDVEWLLMARSRWPGLPAWPLRNWTPPLQAVPRQPVPLPLPTAGAALPTSLSASRLEALRECPYRFFSRAVLRLDETEELDLALAKRDYGSWLHAVLHRFHSHRDEAVPDASALHAAAEHVTAELGIEPADLLPFRASYETLAPAYLAWLAEREAQGWHWINGEVEHERSLSGLIELTLRGRIDRLDAGPHGATLLLDYKTGSTTSLKNKVRHPQEDTQLAFYAALLGGTPSLQAAYLSLDDAQAPTLVEHPKVHLSAQQLLDALGDEWARMSQGAALPALGEGPVCETCEARGLCRRDHWGRR